MAVSASWRHALSENGTTRESCEPKRLTKRVLCSGVEHHENGEPPFPEWQRVLNSKRGLSTSSFTEVDVPDKLGFPGTPRINSDSDVR